MNNSFVYKEALQYATKKHLGQFRKEGVPYITHPIAVAEILKKQGFNEEYQIAGLFHDLLEDTDATEQEILTFGGEKVYEAVKLLTKTEGYIMSEYIRNIKANPIAFKVKAADRLHNLQCAVIADEKFRRKYIKESLEWYTDFDDEIPPAIEALKKTLTSN
ncbi:MAG: HD domain-containing protein [Ruminococcaceae bacterium]|nr:HD domain-containing protein [Oscillospiraceae bacterium]